MKHISNELIVDTFSLKSEDGPQDINNTQDEIKQDNDSSKNEIQHFLDLYSKL